MRRHLVSVLLGPTRGTEPIVNPSRLQRAVYLFCKYVCWFYFRLGWRLRVNGSQNVPLAGPVIIAANHRSYADPPLVGVAVKRNVHFLAKEELFRFRPFGWLISTLNAHPLRRGASDVRAFKASRDILQQGEALILFPEGRRIREDALAPAKAGVGMLAAMAECPVIPAYIQNSAHMNQFKRLSVSFGSPLFAKNYPSYQALADDVMQQISRLKMELEKAKI